MPLAHVSLPALAGAFLVLGSTSWGGVYASLARVEKELVERRRWLDSAELDRLIPVAALVPGPTFVALAGLIGYRLRGWVGAGLAVAALLAPAVALVLALAALVPAAAMTGALARVQRWVAIAVAGILLGAARRQKAKGRAPAGTLLTAAVTVALVAGLQPLLAVALGLGAGAWLVRREEADR